MATKRLTALATAFLAVACGGVHRAAGLVAGHAASASPSEPGRVDLDYDFPEMRDCNGNALDGLETNVRAASEHCGECNFKCQDGCERGLCRVRGPVPAGDAG